MNASELLGHPAFELWAAAIVPFAARFAAAWTIWQRVHGIWTPVIGNPRDRVPPGRSRSTTDPIVAGVWWVIAALASTLLIVPMGPAIDDVGSAVPLTSVLLGISVAVSLVWLLRRIHADDIAWREFRANAGKRGPPPDAG